MEEIPASAITGYAGTEAPDTCHSNHQLWYLEQTPPGELYVSQTMGMCIAVVGGQWVV